MQSANPLITHVLFATDLSENANHAFTYATSIADVYAAKLTVLHVVEPLPPNVEVVVGAFLGFKDPEELRRQSQQALIERLKPGIERFCADSALHSQGCRYMLQRVIVEPGKASRRILHHAADGTYDALVMGSRGHSLIKEVLMGGTSRKVTQECPIPVIIIPERH